MGLTMRVSAFPQASMDLVVARDFVHSQLSVDQLSFFCTRGSKDHPFSLTCTRGFNLSPPSFLSLLPLCTCLFSLLLPRPPSVLASLPQAYWLNSFPYPLLYSPLLSFLRPILPFCLASTAPETKSFTSLSIILQEQVPLVGTPCGIYEYMYAGLNIPEKVHSYVYCKR